MQEITKKETELEEMNKNIVVISGEVLLKIERKESKEKEKREIEKKIDERKSTTDNRFERHKAFGDLVKRGEITEKVKQGLLKWMFYGIDNDNGYQYYLKIKK